MATFDLVPDTGFDIQQEYDLKPDTESLNPVVPLPPMLAGRQPPPDLSSASPLRTPQSPFATEEMAQLGEPTGPMGALKAAGELGFTSYLPSLRVHPRDANSTVDKIAAGIANSVLGVVNTVASPAGGALTLVSAGNPTIAKTTGALLGVHMAVTQSPEFAKAVREGDIQGAAEHATGIVIGGLATLPGAKSLGERLAPKTIASSALPKSTEFLSKQEQAAVNQQLQQEVPAAQPYDPTIEPTPEISRNATEASHALVADTPTSFGQRLMAGIRGLAGESMPQTTAINPRLGEAGVRMAASRVAAEPLAETFSHEVLSAVDPNKFGAALVEDNLRSIRKGFEAAGEPDAALAVGTVIGKKDSPFANEADYQKFLEEPDTQSAIERHKQLWDERIDPMYREAQRMSPDEELAGRGEQTGARINLKAVTEDEQAVKPVSVGGNLTATFRRKSPFGRQAFGTAEVYDTSYPDMMRNTYSRQLEIANKNKFDNMLVEGGNAVIGPPGESPVLADGAATVGFPLRRGVVSTEAGTVPIGKNIYVRKTLAKEYESASGVRLTQDAGPITDFVSKVNRVLNTAALAGLTDATIHVSNLGTALFTRPAGHLLFDTIFSLLGRSDLLAVIPRAVIQSLKDNRSQFSELAEIGAIRPTMQTRNPLGKWIQKADKLVRLMLDTTHSTLIEKGIADGSETARREFVNQVGQYNQRLQGTFSQWLRQTGVGSFVTAGKTFNALGIRTLALSSGVSPVSSAAAWALRANQLSKWIGAAGLVGAMNYAITLSLTGRPGVKLGDIDTGFDNDKGQPLSIPVFTILGYGRALRISGARGIIEAERRGLSVGDALDAAAKDIINSATGPIFGPPVRFATIAATGYPAAIGVSRVAPVVPPGSSQIAQNVGTSLKEANPVIATAFAYREHGFNEALRRQLSRFTLQPGLAPSRSENYARIVTMAQKHNFIDDVVRRARQLPLEQRTDFINKETQGVELNARDHAEIRTRIRYQ